MADKPLSFHTLPHVIESQKLLAQMKQGLYPSPVFHNSEYDRGKSCGLYEKTSDTDGHNAKSSLAKKMACSVCESLVGITCDSGLGYLPWYGSGIIFDYHGVNKIVTAAYKVLGEHRGQEVELLLPNRTKSKGLITCVDAHYNIAIIEANLDNFSCARFAASLMAVGNGVTAVGRNDQFRLMGSVGTVDIRADHLECDVLMSSTCSIAEWGIGGPLVDNSTAEVCGINFFCKQGSTPFMPSNILVKCIEHNLSHGCVTLPWIGWKVRPVNELDIDELEKIYLKYNSFDGVIVKEVMMESPADAAGICPGDIIHLCNDHAINSSPELANVLFEVYDSCRGKTRQSKKRKDTDSGVLSLSVTSGRVVKKIFVRRFIPPVADSWPLLPPLEETTIK